jgi:hypothetical protein
MSIITIPSKVDSYTKVQETRKDNPNILRKDANGLGKANKSNSHDHKEFIWLCRECLLDKQYLGWQLEA